jgi:hypothetical protein
MDLKLLDSVTGANAGFEGELLHPVNNSQLRIFITVLGRDSEDYQRKLSEQNRKRLARQKPGKFVPFSNEELNTMTIELLATITKGWRDEGENLPSSIKIGGETLSCTYANAVRLYTEYPWALEQVDNWVSDRANFLKTSSAS